MTEIKLGIEKLIDDAIVKRAESKESRDYLGLSSIGTECSRELWYSFHQPEKITDPRLNRIFDLGNKIEDYLIELLREAGLTVYTHDENGNQFGIVDGLLAGHIDGVVVGLPESTKPHVLEFKSAKDSRFKEFVKNGYKSDAKYWAQVQTYMYYMKLENALVVIMNKDDCNLYFERIKLDKKFAERKILRGKEIAEMTDDIPARQYTKPTFYKCKFCNYNEKCWEGKDE